MDEYANLLEIDRLCQEILQRSKFLYLSRLYMYPGYLFKKVLRFKSYTVYLLKFNILLINLNFYNYYSMSNFSVLK